MDISALAGKTWGLDPMPVPVKHHGVKTEERYTLTKKPSVRRRTTLMATLSYNNVNIVDIQNLYEAGLNVIKFRMATSTIGDKVLILEKMKQAQSMCCLKYGVEEWPVATAIALKTLVKKTGLLKEDLYEIVLEEGKEVILTNNNKFYNQCDSNLIFVDYSNLNEIEIGSEICIDTDEITMRCIDKIDTTSVKCVVTEPGNLRNLRTLCVRNGKHLPDVLSAVDYELLDFVIEYQIDLITLDYCLNVKTIKKIKQYFAMKETTPPLIFIGISTPIALENIDELLKECDGFEISRDILPYELNNESRYRWIMIQKWIFAKCEWAGKPCILSGGVFQSTVNNGYLNEQELSDLTNALIDGATGICLKDTDNIDYTVDVLKLINEVCCHLEPTFLNKSDIWNIAREVDLPLNAAVAAMHSSVFCATMLNASAIIIPTVSGNTARSLFWMKPNCAVIAVCSKTSVTRFLYTFRNIVPLKFATENKNEGFQKRITHRIKYAIHYALHRGFVTYGNTYVVLRRYNEQSSYCDTIYIDQIDVLKDSWNCDN